MACMDIKLILSAKSHFERFEFSHTFIVTTQPSQDTVLAITKANKVRV